MDSPLRRGTFNLSVLHGGMGLLSFVTYQFLSEGVMGWLLDYWPDAVRKAGRQERAPVPRALPPVPAPGLGRARRRPDGGEFVGPATGRADHPASRRHRARRRRGGIRARAGSRKAGSAAGRAWWRSGPATRSSPPAGWSRESCGCRWSHRRATPRRRGSRTGTRSAFAQPHHSVSAGRFAERTAAPSLLLSIAAFRRGGLHMAKAVARPDYQTGPGLAAELGELAVTLQSGRPRRAHRQARSRCWKWRRRIAS